MRLISALIFLIATSVYGAGSSPWYPVQSQDGGTNLYVLKNGTTNLIPTSAYTSNSLDITNGQTSTNFLVPNTSFAVGLAWGRMYVSTTNNINLVSQLAWYENNDYKSSNMFWLANCTFTNTAQTNNVVSGTNIFGVVSAAGFSTNNLLWFGTSNQFNRIKSISGNTLTMWDNMLYGEASNGIVAKVVEFGGFQIIDGDSSSNWVGQLNFTAPITNCTINGIYRYKR